jgi:hypothetical protein
LAGCRIGSGGFLKLEITMTVAERIVAFHQKLAD